MGEPFLDGALTSTDNYKPYSKRWKNKADRELYTLGYEHYYLTHDYEAYESDEVNYCRFHITPFTARERWPNEDLD